MAPTLVPDKLGEAIAAAETKQPMVQVPIRIGSTGRIVVVAVPPDITDAEAIEWTSWFLGTLIPDLRARPKSPLIVARGGIPS